VQVPVNSRAARRLRNGHPWVYRSDLSGTTELPAASLVQVTDEHGKFLASALASSSSQIALRVISRDVLQDADVPQLIAQRIAQSAAYRQKLVHDSEAYRVVFSEADELPGLIIDRYKNVFCLQALTQAMDREDLRATVLQALHSGFGEEISVFERVDARIRRLESLPEAESRLLYGKESATSFRMNGLEFSFDGNAGQKTGAFLDQRENYVAATKYGHGRALDVFTYQGGFALHLARVCEQVTGVDVSRAALEQAERNEKTNAALLKCDEIEWIEADAFELLKDYSIQGQTYDTIVLDPPAFAKTEKSVEKALTGYKEINLRALKMLKPGGILVTNSCSHHVSEEEFGGALAAAAADARRFVTILEKRTQSQDHPIVATIPETAYLKCLICQVL
jgi:23S rRNA (cytosine1962-C5)-methyltransferase